MTDYSLDRIGERLAHPGREPELARDDRARVEWVLMQTPDTEMLLDVGCSDGALALRWLARPDVHGTVVGIERHPAHWEALQHAHGRLLPYLGEAMTLLSLLTARAFGWAWCCEVLEHLDDVAGPRLVRELRLHASRLVVTVPNRDCLSIPEARQRWQWPDHRRVYTARDLRMELEAGGWQVERLEPIVGEALDDSIWIGAVCR